jgi:hypothetical protein
MNKKIVVLSENNNLSTNDIIKWYKTTEFEYFTFFQASFSIMRFARLWLQEVFRKLHDFLHIDFER